MVLFGQFFGGGVFLALADTDLSSTLLSSIPEYAPGADVHSIITAGASGVRNVVTAEQLPGVILAYNKAIDNVFVSLIFLAQILSSMLIICSIWVPLRPHSQH